jgi:TonB family protein
MFRLVSILILFVSFNNIAQTDSVITYYDNGKIKSIVHVRDEFRDGDAVFYWDNGNIKQELSYVNGRVEGLVRNYNEDGILREMYSIEDGKREGPTSLFDSTGKYIDDIYYEEGILVVEKIVLDAGPKKEDKSSEEKVVVNTPKKQTKKKQNSDDPLPPVIEEEKNYEDDPAFYKTVEVMPEPYGGMEALYKKIGYPYEAKEEEIEGTVKAMVFIDRDGEVLDVQIVEGIGYGCDEAVKTSILYHRFKPGLIRGQKVKVQMEMTFEFKLQKDD